MAFQQINKSGFIVWGDGEKNAEGRDTTKELIGFFTGATPSQKKNWANELHFQSKDNDCLTAFSSAVLDKALLDGDGSPKAALLNKLVKIVYKGVSDNKKKGKNAAKLFDIFVDEKQVCKTPIPF